MPSGAASWDLTAMVHSAFFKVRVWQFPMGSRGLGLRFCMPQGSAKVSFLSEPRSWDAEGGSIRLGQFSYLYLCCFSSMSSAVCPCRGRASLIVKR